MGKTNSELERIFNSYRYQVQNVIDRFIYLHCLKCLLMKATCEREIFKNFQVTKCKGFYSFKLDKNTKRKVLKLNIFYLVEKIVRFHVVQTENQDRLFTAPFTNMRILKFESQPTIAFFAAVNHLNGPLRKLNFTSRVQKVLVCDL